ncbi:hypothetical protein HUT18_02340 [Streptomyces sp. NA04227]|uniref:hypothetical protein n=1 Tax=Streptomyces sp. NA04227 TaxID=2742136 RepID=UPI001591C6B5|nr:hypothetical protein [Streptomyces sp. NA04227]QKW05386.1 hypothetical protein HUT18_02340 [Streptomyces sp. NA04227]
MLASGCTGTGEGTQGKAQGGGSESPSAAGKPSGAESPTGAGGEGGTVPAPAPTIEADPAELPRTAADARALVGKVIAGPDQFGQQVVRAEPYESDPATWSVLGDNCVWRREALPPRVLASLTRHFVIPAAGGKGPVRMTATVTVHPEVSDAAWEQAGMLEEALGCSEQTLRKGEKLSGLLSSASAWGESGNNYAEDSLVEVGFCTSATEGGPYPYMWQQATFGPVVVSVSACAGKGWTSMELMQAATGPVPRMLGRAESEIGRPVEGKSGTGTEREEAGGNRAAGRGAPGPSGGRAAEQGATSKAVL